MDESGGSTTSQYKHQQLGVGADPFQQYYYCNYLLSRQIRDIIALISGIATTNQVNNSFPTLLNHFHLFNFQSNLIEQIRRFRPNIYIYIVSLTHLTVTLLCICIPGDLNALLWVIHPCQYNIWIRLFKITIYQWRWCADRD